MLATRVRIGSGRAIWQKEHSVYLAQDSDFSGTDNGSFRYIGTELEVKIPHIIKGVAVTLYNNMFRDTNVTKVVSDNPNIISMHQMFLTSKATTLDLSSFDTSNVTTMFSMFQNSAATTLDLSSFDTSNVTDMGQMFASSKATTLDLSSFVTSKVANINNMFWGSKATIGYARTQADADKFNATSGKPAGLNFVVKP